MTPTSLRRISASGAEGFTLIEMLVVVTIIGLVGAVAAARLPEASRIGANRRAVAVLREAAEQARQQAITSGDAVQLAPDARLAPLGKITAVAPDGGALVFFADGSSTGGAIALSGKRLFDIDWLTGGIRDAS